MEKGENITLRNVPLEIRQIVIKEQNKEKEKRGSQFSISSTIIKIIREWKLKCGQ
jgi:hypothetical protein